MINPTIGRTVKEYLLVTVGILSYVMAWCIFLIPNNLIGGGVSGISAIIHYATRGWVGVGTSYFVINALLLAVALKVLGFGFGGKTVYAIILASVGLDVFPGLIPAQFIQDFSIANGKLLATILGGVMSGVGIGLAMTNGGSTGGTDIVALIINKYRNITPGKVILTIDVVVIGSSLIIPSFDASGALIPLSGRIATAAYGFILIAVNSYVLDLYLAGSKQSVQVFIFSDKYQEVADAIAFDMDRGVSIISAEGWYSKSPKRIVMVVAHKTDLNVLLRYVKSIDPHAFISVASVMGVYGQGFETIKVKAEPLKEKKTIEK